MKKNAAEKDKKNVTNEELARMIARGFSMTATKADLEATNKKVTSLQGDIYGLKEDVQGLKQGVAQLRADIAERPTREEMVQEIQKVNHAVELNDLRLRVKRLEEKIGLKT